MSGTRRIRGARIVGHGGDAAIEVRGRTLAELFKGGAEGFTRVLTDPRKVRRRVVKEIRIEGERPEDLLVGWLSELLFQFETQGLLFRRFEILRLEQGRMEGLAEGERFDEARHGIRTLVKAPTYHGLQIEQRDGLWHARIVLDL